LGNGGNNGFDSGVTGGGSGSNTGSGGGGACVANAECVPGTTRWCDDPVFCAFGKQQCTSQGTWGKCVEVSDAPAGCDCDMYDQGCCVAAGECCQSEDDNSQSVGNCGGIVCR
jgi:hypothetical protein